MATTPTFRENFLRVIAVIGLIAILLLGAWGIIQLAFYLPTFFGNFGQARESLTAAYPAQSVSDKASPLSWKHAGKDGEYSYSVSYSCAPGLAFAAPVPTGAFQLVKCDTPFNYVNASSTMPMIPVLAPGVKEASTTITVAATRLSDGTISVKGTAKTSVSASTTPAAAAPDAAAKPETPKPAATTPKPASPAKPAATYVPSGRTQNLYGAPDLAVQITASPTQAQAGSRISLQFVITNIGTNVAPAGWTFNAILPYQPIYVYPSGGQQALYPGDRIVYTLGYDVVPAQGGYYGGQAQATIEADPLNYVQESSDYNNTAVSTYQVH
jgi:hypothetical protein